MMAWLYPAALWALAGVALPVLVHLLLRRRAPRLLFPSIRFLRPSDESAVRLRVPADVWLLLVRIAIVACAALAVARPLWVSDARRAAWGGRTVRAIVVDTSASVARGDADAAARAEGQGAFASRRIDAADLRDGLQRAAAWLDAGPPALREIVVVSDFQRGALETEALSRVPPGTGLRMVRVAMQPMSRRFDGDALWHRTETLVPVVDLVRDGTALTWRFAPLSTAGLTIAAPPDVAARLAAVVADAGALAPKPDAPITVRFPPATAPDSLAAAGVLQQALNAQWDGRRWAEREPDVTPPADLLTWTRQPALPSPDAWRRSDESDGRWFWLAALLLLGLETVLRRTRAQRAAVEETHAA